MKNHNNSLLDNLHHRVGATNARLLVMLALMVIGLGLLEGNELLASPGCSRWAFSSPSWDSWRWP